LLEHANLTDDGDEGRRVNACGWRREKAMYLISSQKSSIGLFGNVDMIIARFLLI
jgi:hypothetical protein